MNELIWLYRQRRLTGEIAIFILAWLGGEG